MPDNQNSGEVSAMDAIAAAYNTWPADIRKKLSLHDLRRMTGWRPPSQQPAPAMLNGVEDKARRMFEAHNADANSAPWDRQWEPTREYWRNKARAADNRDAAGVECATCEPGGVWATDGSGPFDCYACGKKPAPTAAPAGEAVAFTDDRMTLTDVSSALAELAEKYEPGERATLTEEERAVLVDFVTGVVDEPLFKAVAGHYFAQNPRPGAHPPAAEVREVDRD